MPSEHLPHSENLKNELNEDPQFVRSYTVLNKYNNSSFNLNNNDNEFNFISQISKQRSGKQSIILNHSNSVLHRPSDSYKTKRILTKTPCLEDSILSNDSQIEIEKINFVIHPIPIFYISTR